MDKTPMPMHSHSTPEDRRLTLPAEACLPTAWSLVLLTGTQTTTSTRPCVHSHTHTHTRSAPENRRLTLPMVACSLTAWSLILPAGLMMTRVVASASMPSVTLLTL
eukprot:scaffold177057_cov23-Tisochrysis_lutea.AAC.2